VNKLSAKVEALAINIQNQPIGRPTIFRTTTATGGFINNRYQEYGEKTYKYGVYPVITKIVSARVIYRNKRGIIYFGPNREGGAEIMKSLDIIIKDAVLQAVERGERYKEQLAATKKTFRA
jgi:hypothetical protein